jgi:pyruvate dehydrogenase phosphatase
MFQGQRDESDNGWPGWGGPWPYTILEEPDLSYHVERLSGHRQIGEVDIVSCQPYPSIGHNQDRYSIEEWSIRDQTWRFLGMFDGEDT